LDIVHNITSVATSRLVVVHYKTTLHESSSLIMRPTPNNTKALDQQCDGESYVAFSVFPTIYMVCQHLHCCGYGHEGLHLKTEHT